MRTFVSLFSYHFLFSQLIWLLIWDEYAVILLGEICGIAYAESSKIHCGSRILLEDRSEWVYLLPVCLCRLLFIALSPLLLSVYDIDWRMWGMKYLSLVGNYSNICSELLKRVFVFHLCSFLLIRWRKLLFSAINLFCLSNPIKENIRSRGKLVGPYEKTTCSCL